MEKEEQSSSLTFDDREKRELAGFGLRSRGRL
jgi:hypothetical protein